MRRDVEIAAWPRSSIIRCRRFSNSPFLGIRRMLLSDGYLLPGRRPNTNKSGWVGGWGGVGVGGCQAEVGDDVGWALLGTTLHATNLICTPHPLQKKKVSLPFSLAGRDKRRLLVCQSLAFTPDQKQLWLVNSHFFPLRVQY